MIPCRLIFDGPDDGPMNMAIDDMLLHSAEEHGISTLRFYAWDQPTLSLGYFQAYAEREKHGASKECAVVRRKSGGGAILHHYEMTYSLALAQPNPATRVASEELYQILHKGLSLALSTIPSSPRLYVPPSVQVALSDLGGAPGAKDRSSPFLCFERRACGDVVLGTTKVIGSAQRKTRRAIMQHGSVLLSKSPFAPELPGIADVCGAEPSVDGIVRQWVSYLREVLELEFREGVPAPAEFELAEKLCQEQFSRDEWTHKR